MIIDIVFAILMVLAIIKGFQRGLIVAVFSVLAFIVGLAAAMKLSSVVADQVGEVVKVSERWLPVISFAIVFIGVVLLVRWLARIIEKTVTFSMLGWLNRLGGILLYTVLYLIILSIVLFYAEQLNLIKADTIQSSVTYSFIKPWGPKAIDGFGRIIPFFSDMFVELEQFFDRVSDKMN